MRQRVVDEVQVHDRGAGPPPLAQHLVDPVGDPSRVDDLLGQWGTAGATVVDLHLVHHSLAHFLEQLDALAS